MNIEYVKHTNFDYVRSGVVALLNISADRIVKTEVLCQGYNI
jgi:hypothetical protein